MNKPLLTLLTLLIVGMGTLWASGTRDDYANSYFTIESLADNDTIKFLILSGVTPEQMTSMSYSTDGTEWTTTMVDSTDQRIIVVLNQGEKVYFKGLGRQTNSDDPYAWCLVRGTAEHVVYGNIMSLLYGDDFASQTALPEGTEFNFCGFFYNDRFLVSAENLVLTTTLTPACYYEMFMNCTKLVSAPALPATTLTENCYVFMFDNCSALTEAPELPATTLATFCYYGMFRHCLSLTEAPALPAATLAYRCYGNMFEDCSALVTAPALPANTLSDRCYSYMFYNCSSLTTAPELPVTTLAYGCYSDMFKGCTSLATPPELPATTLAPFCYQSMFNNCSSLTTAPSVLPATTLAPYCYQSMFNNCSSLTTAPSVLPATTVPVHGYSYMFMDCLSLTEAPKLPATELSERCYFAMFSGCNSLTEAPELPATTLEKSCYAWMFESCFLLTKAPELPAPVLVDSCYQYMFFYCTSLDEVTGLATDISATDCVENWTSFVGPSGTFYKAPEMEDWPLDSGSGIPLGWSVANYDGLDEQQAQVAVYPNPVTDKLHITGADIQSVRLFDPQGRLVRTEESDRADQLELDLQGYAKGVYTVSILSKGRTLTRKVVVK